MKYKEAEKKRLLDSFAVLVTGRWLYLFAISFTGVITKVFGTSNLGFTNLAMGLYISYGLAGQLFVVWLSRKARGWSLKAVKRINAGFIIIESLNFIGIIFFAGGISSGSFLYFFYLIIASAFLYSKRGVVLVATYNSVLYAGLLFLQCFEILPILYRYNHEFERIINTSFTIIFSHVFSVVSSFYVVGLFSGSLAESIRNKEKTIKLEKDKNEAIVKNLQDGLVYINSKDIIELVNPQAEKLLDVKAKDIIGKQVIDVTTEKSPILFQIIHSSGKGTITPLGKPELTYKINDVKIEDIGDGEGEVRIIHDESREKFVDRVKSEFVTIAGHQLRTPLSAIRSALDLVKNGDYGPVNKDQEDILERSVEYTNNLIEIVNDLLNISSIEHGQYSYKFQKTDLHFILRDSVERFMSQAQKKEISINLSVGHNEEEVEVDPYKMKLAVGGLIDNAVSYSPKRSKIEVEGKVEKGEAQISIRDYGIGIPEEEKKKVFTKFFRAPNSLKVKTEGNGLDLFVAKTIVENHHGKIWFESKKGFGTCFYITIPVKQEKNNKEE